MKGLCPFGPTLSSQDDSTDQENVGDPACSGGLRRLQREQLGPTQRANRSSGPVPSVKQSALHRHLPILLLLGAACGSRTGLESNTVAEAGVEDSDAPPPPGVCPAAPKPTRPIAISLGAAVSPFSVVGGGPILASAGCSFAAIGRPRATCLPRCTR